MFQYESAPLRTIVIDEEPWFVASDACKMLTLRDTTSALKMVDDDDQQSLCRSDTPHHFEDVAPQVQFLTVVNESGMYALIFQSRKAEARKIKRWLTHEVLPTIRKTGSYSTAPALSGPELMATALLEAASTLKAKDAQIAELEPKASFYDEFMEADGTYSMLAASKILGWGRNVMMRDLRRIGVLQGNNLPYRKYEHHFKVVPGTYRNAKTNETVPTATTFVRPPGLEFLRKKLVQAPSVIAVD
ncbi:phage antirepressor [Rhodococcus jostii]